ncbi:hypothetical protein [Nesterenkonia rhizosphaerae]|uniref:DUF3854 domain-containing protein n=1 Tax=Nesterenkonia rhizosphaerae TaxID=1348272 RepID=A0ABP9G0V2_9MICC
MSSHSTRIQAVHYRFAADEFGEHLKGHAAAKLADSAVAPAVAVGRGYLRIHDEETFKEYWASTPKNRMRSDSGPYRKTLRSCTGVTEDGVDRDGLVMPWYTFKAHEHAAKEFIDTGNWNVSVKGHEPVLQLRPSDPAPDKSGRPLKYVFPKNAGTPLDVHPATPADWLDSTPVAFFVEGLLKGDAALSAYLAHHGAERELLARTDDGAREALRDFMSTIPGDERVLIVRATGAQTFNKDASSLRTANWKGRKIWVGFDADISSNRQVYNGAAKFIEHMIRYEKIDRYSVLVMPADNTSNKDGVDDFLAHDGDWDALIQHLQDELPEPPKLGQEWILEPGDWRITEDGLSAEELREVTDYNGATTRRWVPASVRIGGRVLASHVKRAPTDQEVRTGLVNEKASNDDEQVEIEVAWRDGGAEHREIITASVEAIMTPPDKWSRGIADVPLILKHHPQWPPRGLKAEKWLEAVKRANTEDKPVHTRWTRMGWVPVDGHVPAFIAGATTVASSEEAAATVESAVDSELPNHDRFGIGGPPHNKALPISHPQWKEQARADLMRMHELLFLNKPFRRSGYAALVICTALRPLIPLPATTPLYLYGRKASGKSMTARFIMHFWSSDLGAWARNLPGSASDTITAMERYISVAPIWVVDDWAPSSNPAQARSQEAAMENLIRNVFNHTAKGRAKSDTSLRERYTPHAQVIITAENDISVPSAAERAMRVAFGKSLNPDTSTTEVVDEDALNEGTFARVAGHFANWIIYEGERRGWDALVKHLEQLLKHEEEMVAVRLEKMGANRSDITRLKSLVANLTITWQLLDRWLHDLGPSPFEPDEGQEPLPESEQWPMFNMMVQKTEYDESSREQPMWSIIEIAMENYAKSQASTPGAQMLDAIRSLLASGRAYISSAEDPLSPPYVADDEDTDLGANVALGWGVRNGDLAPQGTRIGTLVRDLDGADVVLISASTAFEEAKRYYPEQILAGQKSASMFTACWEEGLTHEPSRSRVMKGKSSIIQVRRRSQNIYGVPFDVTRLIGAAGGSGGE